MLELPEIENYRAGLANRFAGAQITGIEATNSKSFQANIEQLKRDAEGKVVWFIERRGKYLLFHLDNGKRLILQLTNAAFLYIGSNDDRPDKQAQLAVCFGDAVLYAGGLRSDHLKLLSVREAESLFSDLGADPIDKKLSLNRFIERFASKRGALRPALLDTSVIQAIGGAYADEILFQAGLLPDTKIPIMDRSAWERLHEAMHKVLEEAITNGGAGDFPLTKDDTATGGHKQYFRVYGREGERCLNCGSEIVSVEQSGRKAYYCPKCQS